MKTNKIIAFGFILFIATVLVLFYTSLPLKQPRPEKQQALIHGLMDPSSATFPEEEFWIDTIYDYNILDTSRRVSIEYNGDWIHMKKGGSYPRTDEATMTYKFWGFGIDIYTELSGGHKSYIINLNGEDLDTVNVANHSHFADTMTYSIRNLKRKNHVLQLRRHGGWTFVFNKFVKFVYSDPNEPDIETPADTVCISDTVFLEPDTVLIHRIDTVYQIDTVQLPSDTIINIVYLHVTDTVLTHQIDTIFVTVYADPDTLYIGSDTVFLKSDTVFLKPDTVKILLQPNIWIIADSTRNEIFQIK